MGHVRFWGHALLRVIQAAGARAHQGSMRRRGAALRMVCAAAISCGLLWQGRFDCGVRGVRSCKLWLLMRTVVCGSFCRRARNISARLNVVTTRAFLCPLRVRESARAAHRRQKGWNRVVPIAHARECSVMPGSKAQSSAHYEMTQVRAAGRPALASAVMRASVRICGMYRCACDKRYIDLCA